MSEIVKKLEGYVNCGVSEEVPCPVLKSDLREAIAALQPSSAEREELAGHLEFIAASWRRERKRPFLVPTAADLDKAAALLRTPVAVDDAMVNVAVANFNFVEADAGLNGLHARMRRALEAALQAGRK